MQRRRFIGGTGAALAAMGARPAPASPAETSSPGGSAGAPFATPAPLVPMQARIDRIVEIMVCTRPFRAAGPRIEAQQWGRQTVVHNYGHGGSGWSLSWGSARLAVELALTTREKRLAVIGCGAIGLTTARVAQRAGLRVRIYSRELPPQVRSSMATGVWSPSSRLCDEAHATPAFRRQWETMARDSHQMYQHLLGLPGEPVEWREGYVLSDIPFGLPLPEPAQPEASAEPDYADLEGELLGDLRPRSVPLAPHQHPFPVPFARRYTQMVFNLPAYSQLLMNEFMRDGGEIVHRDFESPRQFAGLSERTLVNATGYGARALLGDESLVPVRGQIARLVPQPDVRYGITWRGHNLSVVSRRDGLLVQAQGDGDFGNESVAPDRALAEAAVRRLAGLFGRGSAA
ncbi:FAD-dependent oxidoreductase [Caldimonas sp. KR1-144]|uniref:FAD-dependent oxidoreductase n=1 Tax=Caldimonas sp. KR1-144 TaxID=3400911 RepID=UPI003C045DD3